MTLAVLTALFGLLVIANPRVRERVTQLSGDARAEPWSTPDGAIGIAHSAMTLTSDYAADNPVLFPFVVVAAVLFIFMLRT